MPPPANVGQWDAGKCLWEGSVPLFLERALRYRNYAEELRIIAADKTLPENQQLLLKMANEYERLATSLEAMSAAKREQGLPPGFLS